MPSYLTDAEKAALATDFNDVADTFLRAFTVYQEPQKTVIVTDPNWNPYQSFNQNATGIRNTPIPNVISGRILYDKSQEWSFVRPFAGRGVDEGQLKVKDQVTRSVRIKVDASGAALLTTSKQVEIDGNRFTLESVPRPHGLFSPNYYTLYFVRSM